MVKGKDGKYSATLEVPKDTKVLFKFVVDGSWLTIPEFKTERDNSGIENNVLYPADIEIHNEDLVATLAESDANFDSPVLTDTYSVLGGTSVGNAANAAYHSETETSTSFSNVSFNDFSPFAQSATDTNTVNNFVLSGGIDDEDDDVENLSDDLVSSAQITLSGGTEPSSAGRPTLVNIQEGNRRARYYTSMSLLSKFTELFK